MTKACMRVIPRNAESNLFKAKMLSDSTNKIAPNTIMLWGLFPIFSFKLSVLNNIVQIINA